MSEEFKDFLQKHRCNFKNNTSYTHVCMGHPWGRYNIPNKYLEHFYDLYLDSFDKGNLYVAEMNTSFGPFILDIDFIQKGKERNYKIYNVKNIVKVANTVLSYYYKTNDLNLLAFVLEKDKPNFNDKNDEYKDGFHIVYPYINLSHQMRTHLICKIKKIAEKHQLFKTLDNLNTYEDVFDKAIVKTPWLLYGSRKKSGSVYKLTHIFNKNFVSLDKSAYDTKKLIKLLSIRKFIGKDEQQFNLNNISINHIEFIKNKYGPKLIKNDSVKNIQNSSQKDIELAKSLTKILSAERATSYPKWISVCWALKNTSLSLLPDFIKFSQKNPQAFDEYACKNVWNNAIVSSDGLTLKSLHYWAKHDDFVNYKKIMSEYSKK